MTERRVVVTGMGCVTPLGNDLPTFWSNLVAGKNGIGPITKFDTTDFKAMEDSGLAGTLPGERIGVYVGSGIGGIQTFEAEHAKLLNKGPRRVSAYFIPMMIANIASSMIAIRYGCMGPAMPAVTACASGSNAIGEALRVVRHGYADAMICGGAEATVTPLAAAGFCNMQALSTSEDPNAASLPFDARRGGFVMGEGSGILVLEEYEHAKARGAKIYGEVCGYGSTNDAHHITAPHPEGAGGARAMADALREAGYTGDELVYVNAHGTGTHLNDAIETMALKKAFGEGLRRGEGQGAADQLHQVHDRPYAGRGGRGGGHCQPQGSGGGCGAPHHQPSRGRPGLRPQLRPRHGHPGSRDSGPVQLSGLWRPQRLPDLPKAVRCPYA